MGRELKLKFKEPQLKLTERKTTLAKKPAKNKMDDRPSAAVRIRVYKRDRFQCTYCGVPGTDAELEVDHIIPIARGGSNHISNLTTACRKCNAKKGVGEAPRMFSPEKDNPPDTPPVVDPCSMAGLCIHTLTDEGDIKYQGHIIRDLGDRVVAQIYSAMDGRPTNCMIFPKMMMNPERCILYGDHDQMNEAFQVLQRKTFKKMGMEFYEHNPGDEEYTWEVRSLG